MMEDPVKILTDELCSLLDEATILSISSDYDLRDAQEFADARQVLLTISKDVEAEEATGFNPSGLSVDDLIDINQSNQGTSGVRSGQVAESDLKSNDGLTSTTESSQPKSLVSAVSSQTSSQGNPDIIYVGVFDGLSDEEKERQLSAMFVSLKPHDVKLTLQRCKGDASLAIDELLNLQWLEQTGQRPKGIDGFYVSDDDNAPGRKKKKKGRKKNKRKVAKAPAPQRSNSDDATPESNHEDEIDPDKIAFMSANFSLSVPEATDICQRHRASLGAAVISMLDNYLALGLPSPAAEDPPEVREQAKRVPWIPREYLNPIFELTPSPPSALAVVDALADHFERPAYLKYDVSYSLVAAPDAADDPIPSSPPPSPYPSTSTSTPIPALAASKSHSLAAAAALSHRGRSSPLYRQASSFYAARARDQSAAHRLAAARALVDAQSARLPPRTLDLHGATVRDGVAIALERVRGWWWGGGGGGSGGGGGDGFTVVTGIGRHSAGGKSMLRVNVFKALVADGWKVQVLTGSFLVTGRAR